MHTLAQLEKQQVGLRLPKYLIEEIDAFTEQYRINRTDIIIEAIKSYVNEQKIKLFYENFETSCQELKEALSGDRELETLDEIIDNLKNN